ncbi:hypothetical protein B0H16DRAFT_1856647 [Mycena metata]|uniref:Plastocyanin-like domain-containing protein n=1 Tax=Mycena metata TaxID=1033252 RepID=A0AAD7N5C1_9AGAR|nr:hypothetical protein B0H16DRAFT_1856647 [Mycena metata]
MASIASPQVPLRLRPARAAVAVGHGLWRVNRRVRRMLVYLRRPRMLGYLRTQRTLSPSLHAISAFTVRNIVSWSRPTKVSSVHLHQVEIITKPSNYRKPLNHFLDGGNPAHNSNLIITLGPGTLRYEGAPAVEQSGPMTLGPAVPNALVESNLRPLVPIPASARINGIAYISPVVPTLVKILDGASTDADFNQTENMFVFPANKVGYPAQQMHFIVAGTASRGMILRFTTDKPGLWFCHSHPYSPLPPNCHIFYHFVTGFGSVIVGGPDEIRQQVHPTEGWDALCPAYNALPPNEQRCNRASMRE